MRARVRPKCWAASACPADSAITRRSCRGANSSAWRWRGPSSCKPAVLLADEPTGSLDFATGAKVMELMFEMNREAGTTLVLVTHDSGIAARCQRQLGIEAGRLVSDREA